jgi:hypothetical protein
MVNVQRHGQRSVAKTLIPLAVFLLVATRAAAQGVLEIPRQNSFQSGIGIVSGWKCTAGAITVSFNGGPQIPVVYGSDREDTRPVCNDANNGYVLLWNWNLLGDGRHTIQVFDDGVPFASATFTVVTPGEEFFTQGRATITVRNFPRTGETTTLRWQQSTQSFEMVARGAVTVSNVAGTYQYSGVLEANTCSVAPPSTQLAETIRITQQGAALTATTGFAGGVQLNGQLAPDQTFVLFSDPQETAFSAGCTQTLTVLVEGDFTTNVADTTFAYDFTGTCPITDCETIFLGSLTKTR